MYDKIVDLKPNIARLQDDIAVRVKKKHLYLLKRDIVWRIW